MKDFSVCQWRLTRKTLRHELRCRAPTTQRIVTKLGALVHNTPPCVCDAWHTSRHCACARVAERSLDICVDDFIVCQTNRPRPRLQSDCKWPHSSCCMAAGASRWTCTAGHIMLPAPSVRRIPIVNGALAYLATKKKNWCAFHAINKALGPETW